MNAKLIALICALTLHHLYAAEAEVKIAFLKDHHDLIEKAAQLWWAGQGNNQKNFNQEQTKQMADYLRQNAHDQTQKYCLIALQDNEVVGIIQLVDVWTNEIQVAPKIAAHTNQWTPWIRGLVVAQAYRQQGISKQLMKAAEDKAHELGNAFVYVGSDPGLVSMYCENGYESFDSDTFRGAPTILMRKCLGISTECRFAQ